MTKRTKQALVILAVILVVFSIVVFVIPFHKGVTFCVAYIAEIIAIAAQIPIFKIAYDNANDMKSRVLGFPIFRVGYIYLGIQTVVSVILFVLGGIFEKLPAWIALVLCIVIFALALIGSIAADIAREEVEKIEFTTEKQTSVIKQFRTESALLPTLATNPKLKKELEQLADQFQYSDPVSSLELEIIESEIAQDLTELHSAVESGDDSVEQKIFALEKKLEERNLMCRQSKH